MLSLLDVFQSTKEVLCKYDYYIHTPKKILHITNSELKIPHLMGLQYLGGPQQYTGDYGVYAIRKKRVTHKCIEKIVKKHYKNEERQRLILEIIYRKLRNLHLLERMFCSTSQLYLYEKNDETEFNCDYLMVHRSERVILHLGLVKAVTKKGIYHCNSFMATYLSDREKEMYFCNLSHKYEITKIVREDKESKKKETIYQNSDAIDRERMGIRKMLLSAELNADEILIDKIAAINTKFGKYHLLDELMQYENMLMKCSCEQEKLLVKSVYETLKLEHK